MITLTFPDSARREYPEGITGREVAEGIAKSLAKRTVAMTLDGALVDLNDLITRDAQIEFVSRDDPRALELIRRNDKWVEELVSGSSPVCTACSKRLRPLRPLTTPARRPR